ncbi:copper amine oxidase N-terminal domain-containing protein [Anoxynatronum sibiricum]|uniref:Copper amine oxidase N-terminal domain-containing protein n=1 Tax=Anoxynatronum sibiricum TaxID=210623 RepID=A0ABU9VQY1_9CLOT
MKRQHQDSLKVKAAHQCMNGMFTVVIVLLILMAISLLQPIYAQNSLTISLNGQPIIFGETAPVVWEGRTLVPFRRLAEAIGIDVDWQEETQRITATADGVELVMTVGTRMAVFNGSGREMNAAPQILEGRAFIPLRDFSESFGVQVDYQDGHIAMTYDPILYSVNGKLSGFYALGALWCSS